MTKMTITSFLACLFLSISSIQCVDVGVTDFANDATDFSMKLFAEIAKQPDATNIFFSPYSISTAMAMVYIGSKGNTKKQLADVLGYPSDTMTTLTTARHLQQQVFAENREFELDAANKLYLDKGYKVLNEYLDNLETYFNAESDDVDFSTDPSEAREEINDWVAGKTNDNIKALFDEGTITSATLLVLVNALYFKADWLYQFDPKDTKAEPFTTGNGREIDVSMMHMDKVYLRMSEDSERKVKVLELPYKGETLAMYIVLPNSDQDVNKTGELLNSASSVNDLLDSLPLRAVLVNIALPKFEVTQKMPLPSILMALGITDLFSAKSDLSGINPNGGLYVSDIVHQAYISINEEGTEASASTGVAVNRMFRPIKTFKVDRPFMVFIRDKTTKTNLFMGRVVDPGTATQPLKLRMMRSVGNPPPEPGQNVDSSVMHTANLWMHVLLFCITCMF